MDQLKKQTYSLLLFIIESTLLVIPAATSSSVPVPPYSCDSEEKKNTVMRLKIKLGFGIIS